MTSIKVDDKLMKQAIDWSDFKGNTYSIRQDEAYKIAGNLGEVVFSHTYPSAIRISHNDTEADFIYKGKRLDVKTKRTTVNPKPHYEVTISSYQKDFNADIYFFYYFNYSENLIWSLGWLTKTDFFQKARFMRKGEIEQYNNWKISEDCYIAKIADLNKI